jgi:hypothetical protein
MRVACALLWYWELRTYWSEGKENTQNLLAQPEASPKTLLRANTLFTAASVLRFLTGNAETERQYLEESIRIAREQGNAGKGTLALSLGLAGREIFDDDLHGAQTKVEEGLAIARSLGDPWLVALALFWSGSFYVAKRDHMVAQGQLEESLELFQSLGDRRWSARVSDALAREDARQHDYANARLRYEKYLPFLREEKDQRGILAALNVLGVMAHADGNFALAKGYYAESLEFARDLGSGIFAPAKNLGCILLYQGEIDRAKTLFAECMNLARQGGRKATLGYAIQGYAALAAVEKHPRKAITLLAVTRKLQEEAADKYIISPAGEYDFARNLALARQQVDEASFNAAWAEGRTMTLEQAIEYALDENSQLPINQTPISK